MDYANKRRLVRRRKKGWHWGWIGIISGSVFSLLCLVSGEPWYWGVPMICIGIIAVVFKATRRGL